jgi:predicted restriction endonuclease
LPDAADYAAWKNQRAGQTQLRRELIRQRKATCQLCGLTVESQLVCSHVKPWASSGNNEKVDLNNTLLLCKQHDGLFDSGLITFNDKGEMQVSSSVSPENLDRMHLPRSFKLHLNGHAQAYMEWHRTKQFVP